MSRESVNAAYDSDLKRIRLPDLLEGKALLGALAHEMDHHYRDSFYTKAMQDAYSSNNYDQAFRLTVASEARAVVTEAELGLKYYSGHKLGYALDYSKYSEMKNAVLLRYIGMGIAAPYMREDFWDDVHSEVKTYLSSGVAGNVIRSQVTHFMGRPGAQRQVGAFAGSSKYTAPLFDSVTEARMDYLASQIFWAGGSQVTQKVSVSVFDAGVEVGRAEITRYVPAGADFATSAREVGEFVQGLNDRNARSMLDATFERYSGLAANGRGGWMPWSGTIWGGGPGRTVYSPEPIDLPWQPLSTVPSTECDGELLRNEQTLVSSDSAGVAASQLIQASAGFAVPSSSHGRFLPSAFESHMQIACL